MPFPLNLPGRENPTYRTVPLPYFYIMQSKGRETQARKQLANPFITLPKEPRWISFGPYLPAIFLHFV